MFSVNYLLVFHGEKRRSSAYRLFSLHKITTALALLVLKYGSNIHDFPNYYRFMRY